MSPDAALFQMGDALAWIDGLPPVEVSGDSVEVWLYVSDGFVLAAGRTAEVARARGLRRELDMWLKYREDDVGPALSWVITAASDARSVRIYAGLADVIALLGRAGNDGALVDVSELAKRAA